MAHSLNSGGGVFQCDGKPQIMAHGTNYIWTADSHSEALLKVATPELYRQNAFRVLGLPVNVTLREIERHRKKREIMAKLNIDSSGRKQGGYLPLDPPPDRDLIRQAVEHLREPEKRLIDEFFWFWPLTAGLAEDKALEPLSRQNIDEALNIWKKNEKEGCSVSTHNLAVFHHLAVLDMEKDSAGETLSGEELDRCQLLWKSAFEEWQKLLENVKFWSLLTDRIRVVNDPRLTSETARDIYSSLPKALLLINAKLAVRAAEEDKDTVERHILLMKQSGFEERTIKDVLHEAASPIRERIKILCASVTHKAEENPQQANQLLRSLLEKTMPWLQAIDILLPNSSVVRETLHDEVAETVRSCTVIYGNETADWKECLWLIEQTLKIAIGTSLRINLRKDQGHIKKIIKDEEIFGNLKPIDKAPTLGSVFGLGLHVYGHTDIDVDTKSYLTTYYFTVLAIPLFPLCRYRVIPTAGGCSFLGKVPLRTFDKWHLTISVAVIAIIALSIMFSSESGYSSSSPDSNYKPNYRKTYGTKNNYSDTTTYETKYGSQTLLSEINTSKANLKKMEAELQEMDYSLEALSSRIKTLKTQIEKYESYAAKGADVSSYSYQQSIDEHNKLVEQYNTTLITRNAKYVSYEKEFKRVNDLIDKYNRRSN